MHHNWIMDYGTQQVSGVSVVASVQAELDFGLLKKCIQMETERSGCTRIRLRSLIKTEMYSNTL